MNSMTRPVRIGVIGTGQAAGDLLAPALNKLDNALLWSVMSRDIERAQNFAQTHGARAPQSAHTDIESLLNDPELDAVIIATPDHLHAEQAIAAMTAGKHVFIEKPMATTELDARMVAQAQSKTGLVVRIGYHLRYHNGHQEVMKLLKRIAHGKILRLSMDWTHIPDPETHAWRYRQVENGNRWGAVATLGTHAMDLAQFLLVGRHYAHDHLGFDAHIHRNEWGVDTRALITGKQKETLIDIRVGLEGSKKRRIEIECENAVIVCEGTLGASGGGTITVNGELVEFETLCPYQQELCAFASSIRGHNPKFGDSLSTESDRLHRDARDGEMLVHQLVGLSQ